MNQCENPGPSLFERNPFGSFDLEVFVPTFGHLSNCVVE